MISEVSRGMSVPQVFGQHHVKGDGCYKKPCIVWPLLNSAFTPVFAKEVGGHR